MPVSQQKAWRELIEAALSSDAKSAAARQKIVSELLWLSMQLETGSEIDLADARFLIRSARLHVVDEGVFSAANLADLMLQRRGYRSAKSE